MIVLLLAVTGNAGDPPGDDPRPSRRPRRIGERCRPARASRPGVRSPGIPRAGIVVPIGWTGGAYLLPDGRPYY